MSKLCVLSVLAVAARAECESGEVFNDFVGVCVDPSLCCSGLPINGQLPGECLMFDCQSTCELGSVFNFEVYECAELSECCGPPPTNGQRPANCLLLELPYDNCVAYENECVDPYGPRCWCDENGGGCEPIL